VSRSSVSRRVREFVGVALFGAAVIWIIALVSYEASDPVWFFSTGGSADPVNFAGRLGVRVRRLSLSSAQTRWGSASADGSIRLHWRLIHFALPIIDYVVAHELAHLREMNHSPAFWDVVRSVVPDYERHRGALKDDVLPAFD